MLDIPELSCELICDGLHVARLTMRLAYRAKGARGIRLVTDATAAAGMPAGEYRLGGRTISVADGAPRGADNAIAGSALTMEAAVQNAMHLIGIPIEEIAQLPSGNSARLLGLERPKGTIAPGLEADLVVLNQALAVEATMVAGRLVTDPP
jgi:N-acetylglucosamine-6-phosphate deacetylase